MTKKNGKELPPSIIHLSDYEKEFCDGLVREFLDAQASMARAQQAANRALGKMRQYGDMAAARMGYAGEWIVFDKGRVYDRNLALKNGVPPGAFTQSEEMEIPAEAAKMPLPEETRQ